MAAVIVTAVLVAVFNAGNDRAAAKGDLASPIEAQDRTATPADYEGGGLFGTTAETMSSAGRGNSSTAGNDFGAAGTDVDADEYVDAFAFWQRASRRSGTSSADSPGIEFDPDDPFSKKQSETSPEEEAPDDAAEDDDYPRNAFIAGRVLNESGEALIGVGVTATAMHLFDVPPSVTVPVEDLQRHAVSDTAGHYRFEQLAAGEYRLNSVPTELYGMTQMSVRSGVDFADIVVKTQRNLTVVGVVTDTGGQPLAGALVRPQALGERGAYTDSAGRFQLQLRVREQATSLGLRTDLYGYRGKMTLLAADQMSSGQAASVAIELEALDKHTVVTGVLRSAETGEPVPRKTVQLQSAQSRQRHHATSNMDGRFVMTAVEADRSYELLVAGGGGYATYAQPNLFVSDTGLDMELLLQADDERRLVGRMVNLHGMPIPNYSLIARAASPPYQSIRVISDAGGNFVVRNPPQGPLVFESQSLPQMQVSGVQVPDIPEQSVLLTLDIGRDDIYGYVVNENGEPVSVPNVIVSWRHTQDGITSASTRRAAADAQGGFLFRQLGPGVHTINVNAQGYKPARVDHDAALQGYEFVVRLEEDSAG